jgi:hypothetical protein
MATEIDEAVVDLINVAVATLTKGANLFFGPMFPGVDGPACFVLMGAGEPPYVYADGGSGTKLKVASIQTIIMSAPNDYDGGLALAKSVQDALDRQVPTDCVGAMQDESMPHYLNSDEQNHHLFSCNFTVWKRE